MNLREIKKILNKENDKIRENTEISESIDVVSKNLADSKEIIEDALIEIEKQKSYLSR